MKKFGKTKKKRKTDLTDSLRRFREIGADEATFIDFFNEKLSAKILKKGEPEKNRAGRKG